MLKSTKWNKKAIKTVIIQVKINIHAAEGDEFATGGGNDAADGNRLSHKQEKKGSSVKCVDACRV